MLTMALLLQDLVAIPHIPCSVFQSAGSVLLHVYRFMSVHVGLPLMKRDGSGVVIMLEIKLKGI